MSEIVVLPLAEAERPINDNWQAVVDLILANYKSPDIQAARLVCSALAAHKLSDFPPAWVLAIAPPGSMKTDLLESFRGLPRVHFVDEITPKTFISGKVDEVGKKRTRPASWLHRIGNDRIVIGADFSTFTADIKALQTILAQLRRIYDGNYAREFGTEEHQEERSWEGRLTLFAGAVPDIDTHYHLFQKLGERFLRVRWPRAGGVAAGLSAMDHKKELAQRFRAAVHPLVEPILQTQTDQLPVPTIEDSARVRIASVGELIALSRSHVERDRYTREVLDVPVTEGNTRLPQQLCQIARGSALLDGRNSINEEDLHLVCRAALDSLQPVRRTVLVVLIQERDPCSLGLPTTTLDRCLEDLRLVGVCRGPKDPRLTDEARQLARDANLL